MGDVEKAWSCTACTYLNGAAVATCKICGTHKGTLSRRGGRVVPTKQLEILTTVQEAGRTKKRIEAREDAASTTGSSPSESPTGTGVSRKRSVRAASPPETDDLDTVEVTCGDVTVVIHASKTKQFSSPINNSSTRVSRRRTTAS